MYQAHMRAVPFLLLVVFFAGTIAAAASPFFPQAISACELEANSAGQSIAIRLEEPAVAAYVAPVGSEVAMMQPLFGVQTMVRDRGTASPTEAATFIAIQATLKGGGF
jgi:hypothetical protein